MTRETLLDWLSNNDDTDTYCLVQKKVMVFPLLILCVYK